MGTFENRIEHKTNQLGWSVMFTSAVASKFGIPGASESNLSRSFKGLKELPSHETALPLDLLLGRFLTMVKTFDPFRIQLDDPAKAKELLEDFETGRLVVSVRREEPDALVYNVYVIENLIERNRLFQRIQNGEPQWGFQGTPIKDREVANAAVAVLKDTGRSCHVLSIQMRTESSKIAKSLVDLGFVFQEKEN
jgi:hypothetical protein